MNEFYIDIEVGELRPFSSPEGPFAPLIVVPMLPPFLVGDLWGEEAGEPWAPPSADFLLGDYPTFLDGLVTVLPLFIVDPPVSLWLILLTLSSSYELLLVLSLELPLWSSTLIFWVLKSYTIRSFSSLVTSNIPPNMNILDPNDTAACPLLANSVEDVLWYAIFDHYLVVVLNSQRSLSLFVSSSCPPNMKMLVPKPTVECEFLTAGIFLDIESLAENWLQVNIFGAPSYPE